MSEEAFHGLTGEYVKVLCDGNEADPGAVLVAFLTCVGVKLGRAAVFNVSGDLHYPNLFTLVVGRTAKARKSFSTGMAIRTFKRAFPDFMRACVASGMTTGEGIVNRLRDPVESDEDGNESEFFPDKRLLVVENEFGGPLAKMHGTENILSRILRDGFDGNDLETLSKGSPQRVTAPHIGILGCITAEELHQRMPRSEWTNGFANRLLYCSCERTAILPEPALPDLRKLAVLDERLKFLLSGAVIRSDGSEAIGGAYFSKSGQATYKPIYREFESEVETAGGRLTQRASQQLIRLAMIYAYLDGTFEISAEHVFAANSVVRHSMATAETIFGQRLANDTADKIITHLSSKDEGFTRTEIQRALGNHCDAKSLSLALETLLAYNYTTFEKQKTAGKSREVYRLSEEGRKYAGLE
jgi:hypothetical protein